MIRGSAFFIAVPFAASAVWLAIFAAQPRVGALTRAAERRYAQDFSLRSLDGGEWSLSSERGKVVVLNFWSTSCPPCVRETPALIAVAVGYRQRGVTVLGISVDHDEEQDATRAVRRAVERQRIPYRILRQRRANERLPLAIESVPVTLVIDRAGRIARTYYGPVLEALLRSDIEKLLRERP